MKVKKNRTRGDEFGLLLEVQRFSVALEMEQRTGARRLMSLGKVSMWQVIRGAITSIDYRLSPMLRLRTIQIHSPRHLSR